MLTESQIKAIRYYMGDVEGADAFWGDPKAYVVLNALFYPGIRTEAARAAEGKFLNPAILDDPERLRGILEGLLSACEVCALTEERETFRVERFSDYAENRAAGKTISFTSTSTAGFLPAYADRKGIALMSFRLPAGIPCIPMAEVLRYYAKADEAEILLPPGVGLRIREREVPEEFRTITDADGMPPLVYAEVTAEHRRPLPLYDGGIGRQMEAAACRAGQRVYEALMNEIQPDPEDIALYSEWKLAFVSGLCPEPRQRGDSPQCGEMSRSDRGDGRVTRDPSGLP